MAKYFYDETKIGYYEYSYEQFMEHLISDREIFLSLENVKISIYLNNDGKYVFRIGEEKHEFFSKRAIIEFNIYPGNTLSDLWDKVELLDVF